MSLLGKIFKKKEGVEPIIEESEADMPADFERFRLPKREPLRAERESVTDKPIGREIRGPPGPYIPDEFKQDLPEIEKKEEKEKYDRIDMILQKLETIEARLKVIEHRLER